MLHSEAAPARENAPEVFPGKRETEESYCHLLSRSIAHGLEILIAAPADFSLGAAIPCWSCCGENWKITEITEFEVLWDRDFHSGPARTKVLKACVEQGVLLASHPEPEWLADDKQQSFQLFSTLIPHTLPAEPSVAAVRNAVSEFEGLALHSDLTRDRFVIKPRFGYSGRNILVMEKEDFSSLEELASEPSYVIQPFLETRGGIAELGIDARHDLRLIIQDGHFVCCYARLPRDGSYLSNISSGGSIRYFPLTSVPADFIEIAKSVDSAFTQCTPRTLAVDMARGVSGRVWLFELNTRPGFNWDSGSSDDVAASKQLQESSLRRIALMFSGSSPKPAIDWSKAP